jgi:hypothetical protein
VIDRLLFGVASCVFLSSCTYNATVTDRPSFNTLNSYGSEVPGLWLLYVDAANLQRPMKPSGYVCAAHKFPIDAGGPFISSTRQTIDNVVETVEVVEVPPTLEQVRLRRAKGLIVVRGEEIRAKLVVQPGAFSAGMEGEASIVASVTVDGTRGRLLGTTVEGSGRSDAEAGFACEGGGKALGEAVSQGLGDAMRRLGEAIGNSERIRNSSN